MDFEVIREQMDLSGVEQRGSLPPIPPRGTCGSSPGPLLRVSDATQLCAARQPTSTATHILQRYDPRCVNLD
eukprot:m.453438 g.453438  ORF g.453438 m.453438 type:complete len:72 (-) comp20499_c0_seq1:223-438(-)